MTTETLAPDANFAEPAHPSNAARNTLVINLLLVSAFVLMLNETMMNVAIPTIKESLGVTPSGEAAEHSLMTLTLAQVAPILPYLFLVLMLIFRPKGLMGTREG